jgi:pectinesterase inhibitor-like protein
MIRTINARACKPHTTPLLHEYKDDTNMKQALQSCADQYDAIIKGDIPLSLKALRSGDYKFSERGTMDAAVEAGPCEKEFTTRCRSPLSDMNRVVHDVSVVAASIVKTMITS